MTNPTSRMLESDGELSESALAAPEPLYCNECGSPNMPNARFCRKCGHNLEEQEADMVGIASRRLVKSKNEAQEAAAEVVRNSGRNAALLQLFTMMFVGAMSITGLVAAGGTTGGMVLFVLLAWFLVELARSEARGKMTVEYVFTSIITMSFVTGMVITAFVAADGNSSGIGVVILLAWFLVELVRAEGQKKHQ
ncbi:MAG: hypothetical protein OHK0023_20580 [Anaerolineae bacterium]